MRDNSNNNMESFYEENNAQFNSTTNNMKRPLTLDFSNSKSSKRQRFNPSLSTLQPVLSSPDLNKLEMATPDIESYIMNNTTLQTPTPNLGFHPTKVTTEQEDYAKGFEDALISLRNSDNLITNPIIMNSMNGGGVTYTNLDDSFPLAIKEEQTVPNSPPLSPIDMATQEKIKLERKRQRNRVAASKCRKRKLERISKLEDKVKILKGENVELGSVVLCLKEHVSRLKQQVMDHLSAGCTITLNRI